MTDYLHVIVPGSEAPIGFGPDSIPDPILFNSVTAALLDTLYSSNRLVLSGFEGLLPIRVAGGGYSLNSAAITASPGVVAAGDTLQAFCFSAATPNTPRLTTIYIGPEGDEAAIPTFSVTTGSS